MKLYGVTTTYNCEKMVPFVMKYYEEWGYDKVIIYDNESTDNTVELLKQYPFVEIRTFKNLFQITDSDEFEEAKRGVLITGLQDLYREHTSETNGYVEGITEIAWISITDFDEVLYFSSGYSNIAGKLHFLNMITSYGYNIINENMLNLYSDVMPPNKNEFLHKQIKVCNYPGPYRWRKPLLFRLDNMNKVNFTYGQHVGFFSFFNEKPKSLSNTKYLHVFHLKYAFGNSGINTWNSNEILDFNNAKRDTISIEKYFEYKLLNGVTPKENEYSVEVSIDQGTNQTIFKEEIKKWIYENFDENSEILDVGAGCGTYNKLLENRYKNMDAVEIFYPNIIRYGLFEKYRNVFKCNIVDFTYSKYDLIIFGDIIEHLSVKDAQKVLKYAFDKCDNFIVALPYCYTQDEYGGNEWEKHLQDDLTPENVLIRYPMLEELFKNEFCGYYVKKKNN